MVLWVWYGVYTRDVAKYAYLIEITGMAASQRVFVHFPTSFHQNIVNDELFFSISTASFRSSQVSKLVITRVTGIVSGGVGRADRRRGRTLIYLGPPAYSPFFILSFRTWYNCSVRRCIRKSAQNERPQCEATLCMVKQASVSAHDRGPS